MAVMIRDAGVEARVRAERQRADGSRWDETWSGMLVMPPMPNNEHQRLVMKLCAVFSSLLDWDAGDCCLPGANISDRDEDWQFNYRVPDVVVSKAGGTAIDRGTHWVGGPDLIVEIISPGEEPYAKLDFYAGLGVKELLILQRDPWLLERFALHENNLVRADRCDTTGGMIACERLPVIMRLLIENMTNGMIWVV